MVFNTSGIIQRLADMGAVLISFAVGYRVYHWNNQSSVPYNFLEFMGLGLVASVLFISVFHALRLYERHMSLLNVVETRRLLIGWTFGTLVLFAATFYVRLLDLSRLMMSYSVITAFFLLLLERGLFYRFQLVTNLRGGNRHNVLIYGAGVVGRHIYKRIYHSPGLGLAIVGFLDDDSTLWGKEVQITEVRRKNGNFVLGGLDKLEDLTRSKSVREVFIALPSATYQRNLEIVQSCRRLGLSVSVVPPTYGHQMHNLEVEEIGGIPVLREKEHHVYALYPFLKRIFDVVFSLAAISALSPLFAVLSLLVRLDSPGPVIFRQRRVGKNGKEFDFYKFRTMFVQAEPYAFTPQSSSDPRITRFGRWLRRSSLDELPQFWNVLKGDMSIVGPRPEMPFIVAKYNEEQKERLRVKPGITGVWQISAVRGEPIHANMEYDLFYIKHQSFLLDIIIVFKTIVGAIKGIGAH